MGRWSSPSRCQVPPVIWRDVGLHDRGAIVNVDVSREEVLPGCPAGNVLAGDGVQVALVVLGQPRGCKHQRRGHKKSFSPRHRPGEGSQREAFLVRLYPGLHLCLGMFAVLEHHHVRAFIG